MPNNRGTTLLDIYRAFQRSLQDLSARGMGDSEIAANIRREMDDIWHRLSPAEKEWHSQHPQV
jgi:hypothetical protein